MHAVYFRCLILESGMAEQDKLYSVKSVNDTAVAKTRFAFNVTGSLLDLATKLNNKEDAMLNTRRSDATVWTRCNFRSVLKGDRFHFRATQQKRKAEDEETGEAVRWKRCCIRSNGKGIEDLFSSSISGDNVVELQAYNSNKSLSGRSEPFEIEISGRTIDKLDSIKLLEKLLKNIRKFKYVSKSIDCRLKAQLPFELSQLWSLMSSTKYSVFDEANRVLDQKIVACLAKSKVNYTAWKMTQKDLQSVEQMAINHVVRSKSSDLECRLVLKLRALNQGIGGGDGDSNVSDVKTQKMKPLTPNHFCQLTWNGEVKRKFHCEHCMYQTDNRSHLLRHQSSIHNLFKPYHCYICTKEFSRIEHIKQHLVTAHPGVKYEATRAKNLLVFGEQLQRQNQELRRTEEFSDSQLYQNHTKEKANGILQEFQPATADGAKLQKLNFLGEHTRNLLCPYCDFTAQDSSEFLQHFEECRPRSANFCCRVCHKTLPSRDQLQVHYANKHLSLLYCCDLCPFYTASLYTYDWHVAQLHFQKSIKNSCPICHYSFGKQSELVHHIESMHLKQPNCRRNMISSSGEMSAFSSAGGTQYNEYLQDIHGERIGNQWPNGINRNKY